MPDPASLFSNVKFLMRILDPTHVMLIWKLFLKNLIGTVKSISTVQNTVIKAVNFAYTYFVATVMGPIWIPIQQTAVIVTSLWLMTDCL